MIIYLHGLKSQISSEKRAILEKYGNVIAPNLDYKSNPNMIEHLYNTYHNKKIDVIIGSSMGGFAGYHLANLLGVPCMLFNPALPFRNNVEQFVPTNIQMNDPELMRIILGCKDDVITASANLMFFSQNMFDKTDYTIVLEHDLAHQIPITIFEEQSKLFFEDLNKRTWRDIKSFL